ncbi:MAG: hypothetical protein KC615_17620 [Anaerolineae bacterium]|nr:hypothetical protein [Anaerolineae bacterium]
MGKKKKYIRPLSWGRFLTLWLMLAVAVSALSPIISATIMPILGSSMSLFTALLLLSLPTWALQAWGQAYLLRRLFQRPLKYWVPLTVIVMSIGMLMGFVMPSIDWATTATVPFQLLLRNLPMLLLPALIQWVILHRQVKRAWMWFGGALASGGLYLLYAVGTLIFHRTTFWAPQAPMMAGTALVTGLIALLMVFLARRDDRSLHHEDINEDDQPDIQRLIDDASHALEDGQRPLQRGIQSY